DALQPQRNLSLNPLFQVMVIYQEGNPTSDSDAKLNFSSLSLQSKTAKFELLVSFRWESGHVIGGVEYNSDLFENRTIEEFISNLQELFARICSEPVKPLSQLENRGI